MSFPTTAILDNFNRTNVGPPPSASWSAGYGGIFGQFAVVSNQAAVNALTNGYAENYWNVATFADCEAYVTFAAKPADGTFFALMVRTVDIATNPDGYLLVLNAAAGTDTLQIDRGDNGVRTILGAAVSQEVSVGDSIGIQAVGSTFRCWYKASGGSWTELFSRTDATYSAAGNIEIITNSSATVIDDFGGGAYVAPSTYTLAMGQGSYSLTGQAVALPRANVVIKLRGVGASKIGTTSLSAMAQPTGTATNDVLIAFVVDRATSGSSTAPTGWTRQGGAAGTGGRIQVFTAVVGQNGLTGTSWTWSGLLTRAIGRIIGYYDANPNNISDVTPSARINASGTTGTTALTTITPGSMVVAGFGSLANGATWTSEAVATGPTLTERADAANSTYVSLSIADGLLATPGSTGASSATMSAAAANAAILYAIIPTRTATLAQGSTSLTGQAVTLTYTPAGGNKTLAMGQGSATLNGQTVGLLFKRVLTVAQGSASLSGQTVSLLFKHKLTAVQSSYTLSGQSVTLKAERRLALAQGTVTLSGQAVTLKIARKITALQGNYSISGQSVTFTRTGAVQHYTLALDSGAYTQIGPAAALKVGRAMIAVFGALAISGQNASIKTARKLTAAQGTLTQTGRPAGLFQSRKLAPAQGAFTVTGQAAALRAGLILALGFDAYALAGQTITFEYFGGVVTTPDERTLSVAAESRAYVVRADIRSVLVDLENRNYQIGVDLREFSVDAENRTVLVR